MHKPNDGYTQAEMDAMTAEYNRLRAILSLPDDIIASAVELRQVSGRLGMQWEFSGHAYFEAQAPEVYAAIDEQASKPMRPEAIALMRKHGLK